MAAPSAYERYLGKTFVKRFDQPVLTIGPVGLSRYDLAHSLDCAATAKAAGILGNALAQLGIKTVKDALAVNPIDLASIPGVGVTAVYVFLCWQRTERGSDKAVAAWYGHDVKLEALKRRVAKRKARERPAAKGRKARAMRLVKSA
jgi:hypothetical protein